MYYAFINGEPIVKTNDIVTARKHIIKQVEKSPRTKWHTYKCYITTDAKGKSKAEEIAYTNDLYVSGSRSRDWASKKKGMTYWREIVVEGNDIGYIVPETISAMNLSTKRTKKIIAKRM